VKRRGRPTKKARVNQELELTEFIPIEMVSSPVGHSPKRFDPKQEASSDIDFTKTTGLRPISSTTNQSSSVISPLQPCHYKRKYRKLPTETWNNDFF